MNIVFAENDEFIIKVNRLKDQKLQYLQWEKKKGDKVSDRPRWSFENGTVEKQGSAGGYHFTFMDQDFKYIVEMNSMGESEETTGVFLKFRKNGRELYTSKMKSLKK